MVKNISGWKCPYCKTFYVFEDDAKECARNCVEVELIPVEKYGCEMCNYMNSKYSEVEECEETHKRFNDKYYRDYLVKKNFESLAEAASHPSQKTLGEDYDKEKNKKRRGKQNKAFWETNKY